MRILIVGGTVFVGRALTESALRHGHQVTLLNRGQSAAKVPEGVKQLTADRNADLGGLRTLEWDAVIDTCAYYPRQVKTLLAALAGTPHYTLISTISAYGDHSRPGLREDSPLSEALFGEEAPVSAVNYGRLKSACEQVVRERVGPDNLIIRPGIIVGPHDPTGRFGYWMRRFAAGETFVAPADGLDPLQVIDARDLGDWIIRLVEQRTIGAFNAVGPREPLTFGEFVSAGLQVLQSGAQSVWVPRELLEAEKGEGVIKLPLWMPRTDSRAGGMFGADGRKAWAAGLRLRSLAESIVDCQRYETTAAKPVVIGATPAEEQAFLQRFGSRPKS